MEILKPGAAGYEEGRRVFNGMIDRRPALIALCETEDDVRAALDRAARDVKQLLDVIDRLREAGVGFASVPGSSGTTASKSEVGCQ